MAETNNRQAGALGVSDVSLGEDAELAQEFRQVLRDLAGDLASAATGPSVEGLLEEVRGNLEGLLREVREQVAKELAALREERGRLLSAVEVQISKSQEETAVLLGKAVENGLAGASRKLGDDVDEKLRPAVERAAALADLEGALRDEAGRARAAVGDAVERLHQEVQGLSRDGDAVRSSLTNTMQQYEQHAQALRQTVEATAPVLDAACRNLQSSQESLKSMLRGYNETLDKSITALETKFAGILETSLERANQRQSELETRIRSTADRTEEAVVDLMQGNQAHHQAMVDSTAATISQLEFFAKSLRQMRSGVNAIIVLLFGTALGLGYMAYTLLGR